MNEKEFKKKLGCRIHHFRVKAGLTQEQLAEKIDRTQRQISLIEVGNSFPSPITLLKITKTLNCTIQDLFDFDVIGPSENLRENFVNLLESLPQDKLKILYLIGKNI